MENKKKYHGGLKVLLLLLFGMLFAMSSICYAAVNPNDNELEYLYNQIFGKNSENNSYGGDYKNITYPGDSLTLKPTYPNTLETFKTYFKTNNIFNYDKNKSIFFVYYYLNDIYIFMFNANNGKNDNLNHIYLEFENTVSVNKHLSIFAIDDEKNNVSINDGAVLIMNYSPNNNTISFVGFNSNSISTSGKSLQYNFPFTGFNSSNNANGKPVLEPFQGVVSFSSTNSIYTNYNGSNYFTVPQPYLLATNYDGQNIPDEPDIPEDTGNTGEITDNNGDKTGQIDLSGIQNGIGNINQSINNQASAIINNQNENTQEITNSIDNLNETLTNDADDLIDNTIITSGDISNTVDFSTINNNENYNAYTNFWYNLTTGFSNSMTNVVRTLPVEFRNQNYLVNLDDFTVFIPDFLKVFLAIISSVFVCLYITRESKHIVEDIQTASIDNVANKLTEDFETNMF